MKPRRFYRLLCLLLIVAGILTTSVLSLDSPIKQARFFTRPFEYDYLSWTFNAAAQKSAQSQLHVIQRLTPDTQGKVVLRYFDLISQLEQTQSRISVIFTDPNVKDPKTAAADLLSQQNELERILKSLAPITESILQYQVSQVLKDSNLGFLGEPIPPVMFHVSPLPKALIVSPRDVIRQEVNISLLSDLSLEDITALEDAVAGYMNASVLIEDVGGIGVYPTMVQRAGDMRWTLDTITHEWTHNYLTLHPLGLNYDTSPELRTMNETTASIVGTEISAQVINRYYPELAIGGGESSSKALRAPARQDFNFQHEMHITRIRVDELLKEGKITEAEKYMEERRIVFVQHGYMIRKLNQAYFAFHGAYAEEPGGAAGEDPVGPAVRELRSRSASVSDFLKTIARMNSFAQLQEALN